MNRLLTALIAFLLLPFFPAFAQTPAEARQLYTRLRPENKDTMQVEILLKLAAYQIRKTGEFKADLDSAADLIGRAEQMNAGLKNEKGDGYISLTKSYLNEELNQRVKGKEYAEKAIAVFTKTGNYYSLLGESYFQVSRFYSTQDSTIKDMEANVSKAAFFFHKAGNAEREGYCHQFLGDLLLNEGQYSKSQEELKLALQIDQSLPHGDMEGVYDLLGNCFYQAGNFKEALTYGLLAYKTAEPKDPDSRLMCTICTRVGVTFLALDEPDNAIFYSDRALVIAENYKDTDAIYAIAAEGCECRMRMEKGQEALKYLNTIVLRYPVPKGSATNIYMHGSYLTIYTDLKMYEPARQHAEELLALIKKFNVDGAFISNMYHRVIRLYISLKQFDVAGKYLALKISNDKDSKNLSNLAHNQELAFEMDSAQHHFREAVSHLLKFRLFYDSLMNEKKIREISQLELQYETEKKENAIRSRDQDIRVLTQQTELQQLNLKRAALLRNGMVAGACCLIIILTSLFYQYRVKQRANSIVTEKNHSMQVLLEEKEGLLEDKEILMKEIHHRVKNNLHMISSLLESQSAYLEDEALLAIQKSQHRVQAISLIHQKLYMNENVTDVLMSVYLRELISYLQNSFVTDEKITFNLDLDPIGLDVTQAVPVGLIVNEAVTNCLKYAFPGSRRGQIDISMRQAKDGQCVLTITDNGIGLAEGFNDHKRGSLGMSLIDGLSKSLEGTVSILSGAGTTIKIIFINAHILELPNSLAERK